MILELILDSSIGLFNLTRSISLFGLIILLEIMNTLFCMGAFIISYVIYEKKFFTLYKYKHILILKISFKIMTFFLAQSK